jgi:hemolysin D
MNESVKPPSLPERRPAPQLATPVSGADREFLPAALEILETPPAPKRIAVMLTICGFFAAALLWSFIGRLDVHAVAWGKIEAGSKTKVIQPLDPGKVEKIEVENGSRVEAGDRLVTFDPSEALADKNAAQDGLSASRAEVARRRAAIEAVRAVPTDLATQPSEQARQRQGPHVAAPATVAFDASVPAAMQDRERAVLRSDLTQLEDTLKDLHKQILQKDAARRRLEMSIEVQRTLIVTLKDRVAVREAAMKLDVGTKINLFDAMEALQKSLASLASDEGQLIETDAAVEELGGQQLKTVSQFIADNQSKLAEADRKADDLTQQLAKSRARLTRLQLFAPIAGVVQQLAVTTIGQVVTTGQQLMTITPSEGALQVQAYVSNLDIGFVHVGQDAEVKVDSFPFTRFGVIRAKVVKIAADAIDEQDAKRTQANATAAANVATANPAVAPGQQQNFVFPVTLTLERADIDVAGAKIALTPGMTVTAEIKTDSRRVIDYILSPIARIGSEAMKEP